jgi:hypothetical protein
MGAERKSNRKPKSEVRVRVIELHQFVDHNAVLEVLKYSGYRHPRIPENPCAAYRLENMVRPDRLERPTFWFIASELSLTS